MRRTVNFRRAGACLAALLGTFACSSESSQPEGPHEGQRFSEERAFRRAALESSLVDADNGYSQLRLSKYALEDSGEAVGWDALPLYNPPIRPVKLSDVGAFADNPHRPSLPEEGELVPLYDGDLEWTHEALIELGRAAFELWPVQLDAGIGSVLDTRELVERYGLSVDNRERVGGLVRVALPDGSERFALTCATCHTRPDDNGDLIMGATNGVLQLGAVGNRDGAPAGPEWGPGRVDVTQDAQFNPAAIVDLRAVRFQSHLNWAGTLHNSRLSLALRTDTQLITSSGRVIRAPREVSYALAYYLWSLGETPLERDSTATGGDPDGVGAGLFANECATCHQADGRVGPPVALDRIDTDPRVGESTERGTGFYRVPSLWGVAERPRLMHDGAAASLEEMFDPARLEQTPGHPYGLELSEAERTALLGFVRQIGTGPKN